jgi:Cft2 family RNA processing exonuclease
MSSLAFRYEHGGIFLPQLDLWLDPHQRQPGPERVFVSHAHSDHIGRHREVILTAPTARLLAARLGKRRVANVLPFGVPTAFETRGCRWQITLLPAGHILGSAMALIETGGESLLYTGDFKLRPGQAAEPCEPRHADQLIMETTFGRPHYRFPPEAGVYADIARFCRESITNGQIPVLLCYSLGKSQELLRGLIDLERPILLHRETERLTRIYEEFGHSFPAHRIADLSTPPGHVVICPPTCNLSTALRQRDDVRTAVITGWAIDPACRFRMGTDAAFPLSDHADYPELIEFVRQVAPTRVGTLHGFASDFAWRLRDQGLDARALSEPEQLTLRLENPAAEASATVDRSTPGLGDSIFVGARRDPGAR